MKVIIAPDSFKGSISSLDAAKEIATGFQKIFPDAEITLLPIADGGEGTVEAFVMGAGGDYCKATVSGPLGTPLEAVYGILTNGTAVIEMAACSGLPLVAEHLRDPEKATTRGVGELILAALNCGCKSIILGLGGSATNDGGVGMAQALGASFLDGMGQELGPGGGALAQLEHIDLSRLDKRLADTNIVIASDVTSPLCGPAGASYVFGPQKGANPAAVERLDHGLERLAERTSKLMGTNLRDTPGAGAAGGLGFGLMAFCGASMRPGIELVLDTVNFDRHLQGCTLVITGEGRIDGQSVYGKVPVGVAKRAKQSGVPVLAIVGSIGEGAKAVYDCGVNAILSIATGPMPLEQCMSQAALLMRAAGERAARILKIKL